MLIGQTELYGNVCLFNAPPTKEGYTAGEKLNQRHCKPRIT